MSSKLTKGGIADAQIATWLSVKPAPAQGTSPAVFPSVKSNTSAPSLIENEADRKKIRDLEARIRTLEASVVASRQEGLQQGTQQGAQAVRQELSGQMNAVTERMTRTIEEMSGLRQRFRREAERDVVSLALSISKRILHRELTVDSEALLGLVKAALGHMDIRELQRVRVHPEQSTAVRGYLDRLGSPVRVEIVADPSLERGAAILETSHGTLDASASTQLAEIERGFADLVRHAT